MRPLKKWVRRTPKLYTELRKQYQEQGDHEALSRARALLEVQQNITLGDRERLFGFLEGEGRVVLPEPQALLTPNAKMPGLDGQKMSKSYHNTIGLRESADSVEKKIRTMPTDPARVRRNDPGDPGKCPVWPFHEVYSSDEVKEWVVTGCREAGIGCLDCKQHIVDAVQRELEPIRERAEEFASDPKIVKNIVAEGCESARAVARSTMADVRGAMRLETDI